MTHRIVQVFDSTIGDDAIRFGERILIAPGLDKDANASMSAYTSFLAAGAVAELPAPYEEIWVVLCGQLRVGDPNDAVIARTGHFVHIPEQAPGVVEAIDDTTIVCISVPAH